MFDSESFRWEPDPDPIGCMCEDPNCTAKTTTQWGCMLVSADGDVLDSLWSIDLGGESPVTAPYARVIERELREGLEAQREYVLIRGEN